MGLARFSVRYRALRGPNGGRRVQRREQRPVRAAILLLCGHPMTEARKLDRFDFACGAALALGYLVLLLSTVHDLGYARDEGFYFQAARSYEAWFDLLRSDFAKAIEPLESDRYWYVNREHPALMKSLFALSHRYLYT